MQLTEQERVRREKLEGIRALGIDPYPADLYPVDTLASQAKAEFSEGKRVVMAGRLMSRRIQGKASFAELQDSSGRIQVYFNRDELCPGEDKTLYNELYKKLLDIGDFIGIEGELFTTQVGEPTVMVRELKVLSKSLRPLPLPKTDSEGKVHDEFNDPELRYRQRYADLVVNPQVKDTFVITWLDPFEYVLRKKNPKTLLDSTDFHVKIIGISGDSYDFKAYYSGSNFQQKGTAYKIE